MNVLRPMIGLAVALSAACSFTPEEPARRPPPPADNVVLIVVDTLRADRLGCYGYERETSPVVDRLAADGVRFTNAYATSPWTFPSMASIVSSLYVETHGAFIGGAMRNQLETPAPTPLVSGFDTLPEVLEGAGVRTALIGANTYLEFGAEQGFGEVSIRIEDADARAAEAVKWVAGLPRDRRFFLLLHLIDPHEPNRPPARLRRLFGNGASLSDEQLERHAWWRPRWAMPTGWTHEGFEEHRTARTDLYDATVRFADEQVGVVLEAIAGMRPDQETAILFTSDHGEEFWDHAELQSESYGTPPGRTMQGVGHGHTLFQELVRVPLVLYWPQRFAPRVVETPASLVDLMPTVLDLMQVPDLDGLRQGESLLQVAEGGSGRSRPVFFSQPCFGRNKTGVLDGGFKLIRSHGEPTMLFDVVANPGEDDDLSVTRPEERKRLEMLLGENLGRFRAMGEILRSGDSAAPADISPERLEQLRALGYAR